MTRLAKALSGLLMTVCSLSSVAQEEPLEYYGVTFTRVFEGGLKSTLLWAHEEVTDGGFGLISARLPIEDNQFLQAGYLGFLPRSPLTNNRLEDHRLRAGWGIRWAAGGNLFTHLSRLEYRSGQLDEAVRYRPKLRAARSLRILGKSVPFYLSYEPAYDIGKERFAFGLLQTSFFIPVATGVSVELGYFSIRNFVTDITDDGSLVVLHFVF